MWGSCKSRNRRDGGFQGHESNVRRRRAVLIWTERVLLVLGLALIVFYGAARIEGWLTSRAALRRFTESGPADSLADSHAESPADALGSTKQVEHPEPDFSLWSEQRIKTYKHAGDKQAGVPIAVLSIPKIGLEAPLFDGTDKLTLNHAVGRIAGTAYPDEPGNIGIAGHRDGFFRGLKDVSVGDAIELKTHKGTDTYVVNQIQIVSPLQVGVLRPTPVSSLTLVTCYPFYFFGSAPERYIVTASLSTEKNGGPESSKPQHACN
jgi:sortase A